MEKKTTVGFILMLDTSGTMHDATPIVKIDSKAFVRYARPKDQFAINEFNNSASWIYPLSSSSKIATVSGSLIETAAAVQQIETIIQPHSIDFLTNLGEAIRIGNYLISQATTDIKSFVILSDGIWTTGLDPYTILGAEPPIFIAGLGPYMKREYFEPLLSKNPNSRFYNKPYINDMMMVFNDIRALPIDIGLTANDLSRYSGNNYTLTSSTISADCEEAQLSVIWSDKNCQYTTGIPRGNLINVILIDPNGRSTGIKPDITGDGYCIFNLMNPQPGKWQTLVQFNVPHSIYGTSAGFQFDTQVNLLVDAPIVHPLGKPLKFSAKVLDEGKSVENLDINIVITKPIISIENALLKYNRELKSIKPNKKLFEKGMPEEYAKLEALRASKIKKRDILGNTRSVAKMCPKENGSYEFVIADTKEAGSYSVNISVVGTNPCTGKSFSRVKSFTTLVG